MSRFPAAVTRQIVIGAICWTSSIVFFVVQGIAQAASTGPYSLATNLISDLGVTVCGPYPAGGGVIVCSPLHGLMNGTFIVVGLLHTIGAITTRQAWPRRPLSSFGVGSIALAGTGLTLVGFAPENVALGWHTLGALYGIVALNLGVTVLGVALLSATRRLGAVAVAAGIAGLLGTVLFLSSLSSAATLPRGAVERVAVYPATAMLVVLGASLLMLTISTGKEGPRRPPAQR
jgi:hypothetical protein